MYDMLKKAQRQSPWLTLLIILQLTLTAHTVLYTSLRVRVNRP